MITRLFTSALFAGLAAGLIAVLLQFWLVTPVLLEGEEYETGAKTHYAGVLMVDEAQDAHTTETITTDTDADVEEEQAENIFARHATTFFVNLIVFTGFGLIMVAGFGLASHFGIAVNLRSGVMWGLAGFIAVQLAPAAGLPPELPGTPADDVVLRQYWWVTTVAATTIGLAFLAFGNSLLFAALGCVMILTPHVIGAPHLDFHAGIAPPELSALFVARSLAVAAAAWAVLGAIAGHTWDRMAPKN